MKFVHHRLTLRLETAACCRTAFALRSGQQIVEAWLQPVISLVGLTFHWRQIAEGEMFVDISFRPRRQCSPPAAAAFKEEPDEQPSDVLPGSLSGRQSMGLSDRLGR